MGYPQSEQTRIIYCANSCPLERGGYFLFFILVSNLGYHPFPLRQQEEAGDKKFKINLIYLLTN